MCGVRQGGVLSPLLFSVYADDIIDMILTEALWWALDVMLMFIAVMLCMQLIPASASVSLLQRMTDTCCEEAVYFITL